MIKTLRRATDSLQMELSRCEGTTIHGVLRTCCTSKRKVIQAVGVEQEVTDYHNQMRAIADNHTKHRSLSRTMKDITNHALGGEKEVNLKLPHI